MVSSKGPVEAKKEAPPREHSEGEESTSCNGNTMVPQTSSRQSHKVSSHLPSFKEVQSRIGQFTGKWIED